MFALVAVGWLGISVSTKSIKYLIQSNIVLLVRTAVRDGVELLQKNAFDISAEGEFWYCISEFPRYLEDERAFNADESIRICLL